MGIDASTATAPREQLRARYPDDEGFVERDGVRVFWERYGTAGPAFLLMPTWQVVHSRSWRCQIPFLARLGRVVTFDPRGNGRSDRPPDPAAYDTAERVADALAVLDAAGADRVTLLGWCGMGDDIQLAAEHPERVERMILIAPALRLSRSPDVRAGYDFEAELDTDEGWAKENRHFWQRDWRGYLEFFFGECFPEPHSTKQLDDAVGWGLETDAATILAGEDADVATDPDRAIANLRRVRCPVTLIQGTDDRIVGPERCAAVAAHLDDAQVVVFDGSGHGPHLREPIRFNRLVRDLIAPPPRPAWTRAGARPRRALYVSSPIGLGHARRDVAIARELRRRRPELEIEWLAQHPVTAVLESAGEAIHPASVDLASESAHMAADADGHLLDCFQALRRMDEILVANFMVFQDAVEDGRYDLVIADEAWDVDHFLHENPELKRAPLAWLTDFVGYLPLPEGGAREAALTADYNAELIGHVERFGHVRDRALYLGEPGDIVPGTFGPGLPSIRRWTTRHYTCTGYVTGAPPLTAARRRAVRRELGWGDDETVCVVAVGGSGVGSELLQEAIAAHPLAARRIPGLRTVVVAGPRIDAASLPSEPGVELHGYVDRLDERLAAADVAMVQGGLATTMELVANRRPFLSFPLERHFEQRLHVAHRLRRYRAGRQMELATADAEAIADALAEELARPVAYRPVRRDGAARAADVIAQLV
jgi:pimeloyl-ACP methyl ester carboxylesterase